MDSPLAGAVMSSESIRMAGAPAARPSSPAAVLELISGIADVLEAEVDGLAFSENPATAIPLLRVLAELLDAKEQLEDVIDRG
jgi:hypothetical protein